MTEIKRTLPRDRNGKENCNLCVHFGPFMSPCWNCIIGKTNDFEPKPRPMIHGMEEEDNAMCRMTNDYEVY